MQGGLPMTRFVRAAASGAAVAVISWLVFIPPSTAGLLTAASPPVERSQARQSDDTVLAARLPQVVLPRDATPNGYSLERALQESAHYLLLGRNPALRPS